ncbi:MAG TPA: hypothetical protein VJS42_05000 [Steroidobacteraceae bacterium]|nr:hypothetical protein [Steroidobacteraceae bacterium]
MNAFLKHSDLAGTSSHWTRPKCPSFQAAFGTLAENIEAVKPAEKSGADIVPLPTPSSVLADH